MCECNDYSRLTAVNGAVNITDANLNIDGTGAVPVLSAPVTTGAKLKSITIKSTQQTVPGMICLFIVNGGNAVLFDQIPIPEFPSLSSTPTPAPVLPNFVAYKTYNLNLGAGDTIAATTQTAGSFNIIAEVLSVSYPGTLPPVCCNFVQKMPVSGIGTISEAGTIVDIFKNAAQGISGAVVKNISISALAATYDDVVGIYLNNDGNYFLMNEIYIPQSVQTSFQPVYNVFLNQKFNLQAGFGISLSSESGQSYAVAVTGQTWLYP